MIVRLAAIAIASYIAGLGLGAAGAAAAWAAASHETRYRLPRRTK